MSQLHREGRFDGVERADSLTWNPHKLLGALLQCATFHLKEKVIAAKNTVDINTACELYTGRVNFNDLAFEISDPNYLRIYMYIAYGSIWQLLWPLQPQRSNLTSYLITTPITYSSMCI